MAMMAMTTSNSISVNALRGPGLVFISAPLADQTWTLHRNCHFTGFACAKPRPAPTRPGQGSSPSSPGGRSHGQHHGGVESLGWNTAKAVEVKLRTVSFASFRFRGGGRTFEGTQPIAQAFCLD